MSTNVSAQQVNSKTASDRLLDLLAGWSAYVSADEENNVEDAALSAEGIGALYQLAGELSESGITNRGVCTVTRVAPTITMRGWASR